MAEHNIQKTIMAPSPITSWEIDGETVETVSDFIFGGSKITADGDCSHEIKRCSLLGRKVMTNLDCIFFRIVTLRGHIPILKMLLLGIRIPLGICLQNQGYPPDIPCKSSLSL